MSFFPWRETRVTAMTDMITACVCLANLQSAFYNLMNFFGKAGLAQDHFANRAAVLCFFASSLLLRFGGFVWLLCHFAFIHGLSATALHGWTLMPFHCQVASGVLLSLNAIWLPIVASSSRLIPALFNRQERSKCQNGAC
jgi:hypothetical protein